ncbi:CHAT domain-containing protein [Scytonema sp. UIC 10036]|uniref:CHAT domain-containing protein n=1 Tax=Scytonema sp. UIC 10036 TaxID=2304196 RepID=UPI0012DA8C12|nr:CHAT domain-containing tetratricopeptide repeat protein [Scytonema sp. UIC 10036]MUG92909.1 CHAT domain-containing protein [Scytonema sp. UIC 10036]
MKSINTQNDGLASSMLQVVSLLIAIGQNIAFDSTRNNQQIIDCYKQIQERLRHIKPSFGETFLANLFLSFYQGMMNQSGGAGFLTQIGIAYSLQGQYQQAIELYQTAQQIYHSSRNLFGEAETLHNLGNVYFFLGQYEQARDDYKKAKNIWSNLNEKYREAHCLKNLGTVHLSLGQLELGQLEQVQKSYEEARKYYNQAINIFQNLNKKLDEAITLSELGLVKFFFLEQADLGIEMIQKSLSIHRQQYKRNPVLEATSLTYLGVAYLILGQYQQAIEYLQQSLNILQDISSIPKQAFTLAALGLAFFKAGNLADAQRTLQDSIKMRQDLRSKLIDLNKVSFFDLQIDTYGVLQQVLIDRGQPETALEISERGRACAFAELLASLSDEQLVIHSPHLNQIREIAQKQNVTMVEYSIIYDWVLNQGIQSRRDLKLFIWLIKPIGEVVFRSTNLQLILEQINYVFLGELVDKARASIGIQDKKVADFEWQFTVDNQGINPHLHQLYQILIQPIAEHLPDNPNAIITFIPQGSLFVIPFSALQDEEGNFLIQKHTIVSVPSIQALELTQKRSAEIPETSLEALVVGNPKMPTIPLTDPPIQLQNLWAQAEAQAIAHLFNTQAITGGDATKVHIQQLLPKARLIHLATHYLLDNIQQLGIPGAIALTLSDNDNGFLTAGEIYDMKLNAELVVLSDSCTGLGKITRYGVIGLSHCLIAAGVKCVIVSLWSVDDLSTALLMVKFYQIFQQGVAASIALNQAQRWLCGVTKTELAVWVKTNEKFFNPTLKINLHRRLHQLDDNAKLFQHPRYWAAFCAIGQ